MARRRNDYLDDERINALLNLVDEDDDQLGDLIVDDVLSDDEDDTVAQTEEVIVLQEDDQNPARSRSPSPVPTPPPASPQSNTRGSPPAKRRRLATTPQRPAYNSGKLIKIFAL